LSWQNDKRGIVPESTDGLATALTVADTAKGCSAAQDLMKHLAGPYSYQLDQQYAGRDVGLDNCLLKQRTHGGERAPMNGRWS